ncbi:hypothetical protein WR25_15763 [Diploscapter pachys]|uniref:Homeobox domain-containing protein n=1 Tax=Diploscapter pachys TaxID=2018661 RepID=A0A2A2J5S3_9BILA|nr:hypothetical protein WR25_15763 [Diploscapter pachys]
MSEFSSVASSAFRPYQPVNRPLPPPLAIPSSICPSFSSELSPPASLTSIIKSASSDSASSSTSLGILENKRRKRTTFSASQCAILEQEYNADRYMPREKRIAFAKQLQLTENQIKTWYQNRRAKDKRERRHDSSPPPSACSLPLSAGLPPALPQSFPIPTSALAVDDSYHLDRPFSLTPSSISSPPLVETPPMVLPTSLPLSTSDPILPDPTSIANLQSLLSCKPIPLPLTDPPSSLISVLLPSLYDSISIIPPFYSSPSINLTSSPFMTSPNPIINQTYQF